MIIIVDGDDGLISGQAELLFNLSQFDIRRLLSSLDLPHRKLTGAALLTLKEEGIVSFQAKQATFIPRSSLSSIIDCVCTSETRRLYSMIWPQTRKAKSETSFPRRSFRSSVVRNLRKHSEEIRLLRTEIEELRAVVEDLLHVDMQIMMNKMVRNKIPAKDVAEIANEYPE
jgi:hypothetical protein